MEVRGQLHAPATLSPGKKSGTHLTGGLVGLRDFVEETKSVSRYPSDKISVTPFFGPESWSVIVGEGNELMAV